MNDYIRKISNMPDFEQKDYFKGYFLSTGKLGVEVDYIEMESGHQFYQKESKSIHIYYILEGSGIASIDGISTILKKEILLKFQLILSMLLKEK